MARRMKKGGSAWKFSMRSLLLRVLRPAAITLKRHPSTASCQHTPPHMQTTPICDMTESSFSTQSTHVRSVRTAHCPEQDVDSPTPSRSRQDSTSCSDAAESPSGVACVMTASPLLDISTRKRRGSEEVFQCFSESEEPRMRKRSCDSSFEFDMTAHAGICGPWAMQVKGEESWRERL
eukprot:909618-Rhodomonas_salina.2